MSAVPKTTQAANLSAQNIARLLFAATKEEPHTNPGTVKFFQGLVVAQSYFIVLLMLVVLMTSIAFAPQIIYHLVILDKEGLPTVMRDANNQLIPNQYNYRPYLLYALDEPNLTHTAVLNMAMNVATQVLTFGFNNADTRLLGARHLFTDKAWLGFGRAYLKDGRLDKIKKFQQVITAVAGDGAVIVSEGKVKGVDQWVVQVPLITTYQAGSKSLPKRSVLHLTLVRASTLTHPEGVAIDGWQELPAGVYIKPGWAD